MAEQSVFEKIDQDLCKNMKKFVQKHEKSDKSRTFSGKVDLQVFRKKELKKMAEQQVRSKKVNQLRPSDFGVNITVKVISKKSIAQRNRLAECLVGDETGIIIFTARNDQLNYFSPRV